MNTAIEGASADKDIATLKQAQNRVMHVASLRQLPCRVDSGDGGREEWSESGLRPTEPVSLPEAFGGD